MKDTWPQQCRQTVQRAKRPLHVLAMFVIALGAILYAIGDAPKAWQRVTGAESLPVVRCIEGGAR